jgi:hypothetical protein
MVNFIYFSSINSVMAEDKCTFDNTPAQYVSCVGQKFGNFWHSIQGDWQAVLNSPGTASVSQWITVISMSCIVIVLIIMGRRKD